VNDDSVSGGKKDFESVAVLKEFLSQLNIIIDFAVKYDVDALVLVGLRLGAAFQIDDAQAAIAQGDVGPLTK